MRRHQLAERFYNWGIYPGSDAVSQMMRNVSLTFVHALGGTPGDPWYERHRQEYVRTGDMAELDRMLRHVTA